MSDKAHGGLTGAYYGPPVPPPSHTSRSVGRGSSDCCCCLPCCILSTIFKLMISILLILGILVLVVWLVFRPNRLVVYAEDASLTRFDLTSPDGHNLAYNLSVGLSIRNPNRRIALYYDRLEAAASYDGYRFGYDYGVPTFFQDHKNTTLLRAGFDGQQALAVGSVADAFRKDKGEGWFDIQLKLYTKVRLKVWFIKTNKYSPDFTCDLRLPAPTANGIAAPGFSRTKCSVAYF